MKFFIVNPKTLNLSKKEKNIRWEKEVLILVKKKQLTHLYIKVFGKLNTINDKEQLKYFEK